MSSFDSIERAISDVRDGRMIVVVDDEARENEGDLIMAASKVTAADVNFMARYGCGLICAPISVEIAGHLDLPLMVDNNTDRMCTNFTVSIDYRHGTTTGISMFDRAKTLNALSDPLSVKADFLRPGHVFPLISNTGGVLSRKGHTEATIDIVHLAGLPKAGVLCEIIKEDGKMARMSDLLEFSRKYNLTIITIGELVDYLKK